MGSSLCSMLEPEIFQSTAPRKALVGAVSEDMFCEECWWGRVCGDRENQFEPGPFVLEPVAAVARAVGMARLILRQAKRCPALPF